MTDKLILDKEIKDWYNEYIAKADMDDATKILIIGNLRGFVAKHCTSMDDRETRLELESIGNLYSQAIEDKEYAESRASRLAAEVERLQIEIVNRG